MSLVLESQLDCEETLHACVNLESLDQAGGVMQLRLFEDFLCLQTRNS